MEQLGFHWTDFHEIWYSSAFRKSVEWKKVSLKSTLPEGLCTVMTISRWIFLRMRNVSDKSCTENQNTHFMFNNFFYPKIVPLMRWRGKIWYNQTGYRWQYNTAHTLCVLDNWGYRHTLRICNTYCFYTATMVTRTRLNITLYVHCLSC
jgi:hypothetical protein